MRTREAPGEQTTVATATSVGERVQKTERLFNPHGSPSITWEGGEDESALKDIRKQSAAQRVPTQLRSSFQPESRREATCTEHPKEPVSEKVSGTSTIKTQESIALEDRELSGDEEDAMRGSRQAEPPDEELPERGSPVEVQQTLHQEEIARRGGNGKETQESSGDGDKRPAGIAAPREEWEDFVGAVEDKGDADDPRNATQSQAGHPVPAGHGSCQYLRLEPGKLHSELREKKELRPGRSSPSFDAATGRRTNRGSVPPAYGDLSLALVMHSNEGGPGPRHNMKEDPGTFTLVMKGEHGQEVPCDQRWAKGPIDLSSDTDSIFRFYWTIQSFDVKFRFLYRPIVSVRFEFRFFNRPILFLGLKF